MDVRIARIFYGFLILKHLIRLLKSKIRKNPMKICVIRVPIVSQPNNILHLNLLR